MQKGPDFGAVMTATAKVMVVVSTISVATQKSKRALRVSSPSPAPPLLASFMTSRYALRSEVGSSDAKGEDELLLRVCRCIHEAYPVMARSEWQTPVCGPVSRHHPMNTR